MKNLKYILILTSLILASSCNKTPAPKTPGIAGTWELIEVQYTKSAQIGDQTIQVVIEFAAEGTFSMSQILGDGRAREYTGNWTLADDTLSGTYSDGKPWGATYKVSVDGDTMSMIPMDKSAPETYIYKRF
ncbi:MAG: lipocalin family protein [Candidatus Cryptobacteroides sp.]